MFESITRHSVTGDLYIRGTQVPVDFVMDMMADGYEFETVARALIEDRQEDALRAVTCALLFPEALIGSRN